MNIRTIANETRRGCGYRKPGGLYLVAGRSKDPCGKLPLPLETCPVCGGGIHPARGWTWINARRLFEGVECILKALIMPANYSCILDKPPEKTGLLWIGEKFYKTPADYLKEGIEQGICRRISVIPHDFKLGSTWVLFAHRKTVECLTCHTVGKLNNEALDPCPDCKGKGYIPGIFGCFLPQRIEYIVKDDDDEEKLQRLEDRGITLIRLIRTDDGNGNGVLDLEPAETGAAG